MIRNFGALVPFVKSSSNLNGSRVTLLLARNASTSNEPVEDKKPKKEVKRESLKSMFLSLFKGMESGIEKEKIIDLNEIKLPHVAELSTGESKLLLLAYEHGMVDPYDTFPYENAGRHGLTIDDPIKIQCWGDERIVACKCEPASTYLCFKRISKYEGPTRCNCGFWIEAVEGDRFWEKLPKDELLTIPHFRFLYENGKLDFPDITDIQLEEEKKAKEGKDKPAEKK